MAILDIREYATLAKDQDGRPLAAGQEPALAGQQVTFTTATQSAAFGSTTRFVRLHSDSNCRILFGDNPTAAGTSPRLAAGASEYFGVVPGQKVSAVTST